MILPLSVAIPTSSKPMFSMFAVTPTADKTISASIVSSPFLVLTLTLQPFPLVSTLVTSASVIMLMPLFLKLFANCFETSSSSTGTTLGMYSTTVTSTPIAL